MVEVSAGPKELTQPPKNVKEAIDWLASIEGYGVSSWSSWEKSEELEKALEKLNGFDTTAFRNHEFGGVTLSEIIRIFARGLGSGFLGYDGMNRGEFTVNGLMRKDGEYKSAYHDRNWEQDEHIYAKTFLFLVCLVFYIITFLYWMCKDNGRWANGTFTVSNAPGKFFEAMGYDQSQLDQQKNGDTIADRLTDTFNGFSELQAAYGSGGSSSYSTFIEKLEEDGPMKALSFPLTNCKRFCYEYLKSKQNGTEITKAIDSIKEELKSISTKNDTSSTNNFSALQQKITNLLEKIKTFNPTTGSSEPGSDGLQKAGSSGPGGAKTLVNGLLRIG
ncbi:variant erythrocyte surface antigen-1 family protein [Babesia caballi]|uniref:Variant erythrocyte surface antigen-1 family protein n=1 Tax=Babesia caballi TaxID=5871 RepID=A0AAV4LSN8_BABCB|nr:variant erythrocyte surface antigen-1 family protein [Babesia caballi]